MDGGWGKWSRFSKCSKTCGRGVKSRFRDCNDPSPSDGGKECEGEYFESQDCNTDPCKSHKSLVYNILLIKKHRPCLGKVDGRWSRWSAWSSCTKDCETGTQRRERTCTKPSPAHGGRDCQGEDSKTRECNTEPCVPGTLKQLV